MELYLRSSIRLHVAMSDEVNTGTTSPFCSYIVNVVLEATASVVSGQSSWLQIRRPGFDSRHSQKKKIVGLELGALSLVSTIE
jgi:hypothetical protein